MRSAAISKRLARSGEAAAGEVAIHFAIDGEESFAQRRIGQMSGEARAIASGGREFGDGLRQRRAEARHVNDARELGTIEAARGRFHDEMERGVGDLGRIGGVGFDEGVQGLNHRRAAKTKTFAGQLILQVLRQGCGGHEQADGIVAARARRRGVGRESMPFCRSLQDP